MVGTQRRGQHLEQCVQSLVHLSKAFDLCNGMKHRSVVSAIVKASNSGGAPPGHVLREIHGNLAG